MNASLKDTAMIKLRKARFYLLPTELFIKTSSAKEDLLKLCHGKLSFTFGYIASSASLSRTLSVSIKMFGNHL